MSPSFPVEGRAPHGREHDRVVVLHESAREAIVVKPAGLSVELPGGEADSTSLLAWARRRWPHATPRLPHRLDRMARGLVVMALDDEAAAFHARMVAERRWTKHYLARVALGRSSAGKTLDPRSLLGEHRTHLRTRGRRAEVVRSGGKRSVLEVVAGAPVTPVTPGAGGTTRASAGFESAGRDGREVCDDVGLKADLQEAHLLIRLETGRFHQIRAMLAHLGAPIAGDELYGGGDARSARPPYLEHVVLSLPLAGAAEATPSLSSSEALTTFWWRDDPDREAVAPSIMTALLTVAGRAAASP